MLFWSKVAVRTAFKQLRKPQYGLQRCFHFVPGVDYELALEPVYLQQLLRRFQSLFVFALKVLQLLPGLGLKASSDIRFIASLCLEQRCLCKHPPSLILRAS